MIDIGLLGAPKAGKDAFASCLVEKGYTRLAFADQIKEEYYKVSGFSEHDFKAGSFETENKIRKDLWKYSANAIENHGDFYFIEPVINRALRSRPFIITDIRTTDELYSVQKIGTVKVFWIIRDYFNTVREAWKYGVIPGTKIPLSITGKFVKFFNEYKDLDGLYRAIYKFLEEEKYMLEDDPYHSKYIK